jgi:hypothetical protein
MKQKTEELLKFWCKWVGDLKLNYTDFVQYCHLQIVRSASQSALNSDIIQAIPAIIYDRFFKDGFSFASEALRYAWFYSVHCIYLYVSDLCGQVI